jgi:putative sigma-54 modulation protein
VDIAIRGRNVEVSDVVRATVEEKVRRVTRFLDGMERAEVRFSEERNPRISEKEVCEVTVHGHGHVVRARAAAPDVLAAVDRVVDKLEHQVGKLKGKLVARSHPRRHAPVDSAPDAAGTDEEHVPDGSPRIVKVKRFEIKPMTPEEAAMQMDLLGHEFYFFANAETEQCAVVYRRRDGQVGLIEAS